MRQRPPAADFVPLHLTAILHTLQRLAARATRLAAVALALTSPAAAPTRAADRCPPGRPSPAFEIKRYNADIETAPPVGSVRAGDLVEFNADKMRDPVSYLRAVQARGGLAEWYWVGANCYRGSDCDGLADAGVKLGSTGTAEWDRDERRIDGVDHPAVVARARREFRRALAAAGAAGSDLAFRIDNMHDLSDARFYSREQVRPYAALQGVTAAWSATVAEARKAGTLPASAMVGLTAHNNFAYWRRHLEEKGVPPLLLRFENPTQFPADYAIGAELSRRYAIPLLAIEFRRGHLYQPSPKAIDLAAAQASLLVLMADEDHYIGGEMRLGPGTRQISLSGSAPARCRPPSLPIRPLLPGD